MYLHIGNEKIIKTDDVIGIFDLDTATIGKHTRNYLKCAEKRGEVENVTYELPKTFIVCSSKGKNKVYITQISSSTLNKRSFNVNQ